MNDNLVTNEAPIVSSTVAPRPVRIQVIDDDSNLTRLLGDPWRAPATR